MPPKKKLSKKEKARLEAEQAELLRIEMEKEKQRKLEEERQRRELERQEAIRRQHNEIEENKKRRAQLKASMAFFDDVRQRVDAIKTRAREECAWQKFMRCNGLPDANCPSQLREYVHQWKGAIEQRDRETRNWLLSTDERTLLTHDANVQDLTRSNLRKKQGNLGDVYARRVDEVLGVLRELNEAIADKTKPVHITDDLVRLKTEMRVFLKEFLDKFTYKTMSHIERDMEIDRPGVCRHVYGSEVFKSHIWTFSKDAQISANPRSRIGEQNLPNEVTFPSIDMEILLPSPVQLPSSAMRGLWLNFDHFSDYCPSFSLKKPRPDNITILYQTKKEWQKRKEILQNLIDECSLECPLSAAVLQPSHEDSVASRKPKERSYDIDKLYGEYEEELNKAHRRAIGPDAFGLIDTDVNLRKYRIISGVYCIDHLETPEQDKRLNATTFIRTIIAPDRITHKSFFQTYKPPPPVQPGVRRLPEEIEAEMRMIEAALDKLALVTVQLPDSVIWFEPPIACRWETQMESFEADLTAGVKPPQATATPTEITPLSTTANPSPLKSSPRRPMRLGRDENALLPVREVTDFDMLAIPPDVDIYGLLRDFVVPRLPAGFCVRMCGGAVDGDAAVHEPAEREPPQDGLPQKVLFLARPKLRRRGTLEEGCELRILQPAGDRDGGGEGGGGSPSLLRNKVNIDEDYLDLDEPRELFPVVKLSKQLVFKSKVPVSEATGTAVNYGDESPPPLASESATRQMLVGPTNGRRSSSSAMGSGGANGCGNVHGNGTRNDNANPNKANGHSRHANGSGGGGNGSTVAAATNGCGNNGNNNTHNHNGDGNKRHNKGTQRHAQKAASPTKVGRRTLARTGSSYMFSELIEDLDNLVGLQMPSVEEAVNQISASLTSSSSTGDSASEPSADTDADGEATGDAAIDATMDPLQAAAFAFGIPGISLLRDLAMGNQAKVEEVAEGEEDSASSSEFDDEYADDLDLEGATAFSPGSTARRQQQDAGGDVQDFLSKHNQSEMDTSYSSGCTEDKRHKLSSIDAFKRGKWSIRDVHDQKFNEDKLSIQFRTGRLGIFGFALNRYTNMPYQTWEIKPDFKTPDTIQFSFTASIINIDMTITPAGYCVNNFQGGSTDTINDMLGKTYSLEQLKSILISSAVDIFPDEDAFCYTEGSCEKNYVMEMHTYACMATLALSHNFSWSRWNLLAGNRTAVLLMRELIEGKKVPYHSTLLVTPLKTAIIDCTEVSASFNAVGIAGMEYYADLYQLSQAYAQPSSLQKQRTMEPMLRDHVTRLFMAIRPLSFC